MRLAIVIATSFDRPRQARRARAAYLRETPGAPQIVLSAGRNLAHAWERALPFVDESVELIHFGSDRLEPHPGWYAAARADGRRLAAPCLWGFDGTPPEEGGDWSPAERSEYPTMTREQLRRFGLPPLAADCGATFCVRTNYAFTVVDEDVRPWPPSA